MPSFEGFICEEGSRTNMEKVTITGEVDEIAVSGNVTDAGNTDLSNIAVMKVDQGTGSVIWIKEIKQADEYFQSGYSIGALEGNEMMVCGRANTAIGFQAIAVKLSADGGIIWAREYGDGPYESLGFLKIDFLGLKN